MKKFLHHLGCVMLLALWLSPMHAMAINFSTWSKENIPTIGSSYSNEQISAKLLAYAPKGVGPDRPLWLGLLLSPHPHWHTYWKNPGDSGMETSLRWSLPEHVRVGAVEWPTPERIQLGSITDFGYARSVLLTSPVTIDARGAMPSSLTFKLHANWLVCQTECLPQEADFSITLPLFSQPVTAHQTLFDQVTHQLPKLFQGTSHLAFVSGVWQLQLAGLPDAWRGKNLTIYPETPDIFHNESLPDSNQSHGQQWNGSVWTATLKPSTDIVSEKSVKGVLNVAWREKSFRLPLEFSQQVILPHDAAPSSLKTTQEAPKNSITQQVTLAATSQTTPASSSHLYFLLMLFGALLGGMILNLMPCVFPVLAIKVVGLATHSQHKRSHALAYGAGIVLSMLFLGGLLLLLRALGAGLGWGFQLQSPMVLIAMAVLFTLIGLNLMGLFEFGTIMPSSLAGKQLQHPLANAFLSGLLTVAVASPCTAPFMGASIGLAVTLPTISALLIFASLGMGLALPYILLCWFPIFTRWMPKPGVWMHHLRIFMAFPMWLTVVWLLWILGRLTSDTSAMTLLAALFVLSCLIWTITLKGRARIVYGVFALLGIMGLVVLNGNAWTTVRGTAIQYAAQSDENKQLEWQDWSEEKRSQAISSHRPVLVDFTAAWCITCQYNLNVFEDPQIKQELQKKHFVLLKADWTQKNQAITQALARLGRSGVPTSAIYQSDKAPMILPELLDKATILAYLEKVNP